MLKGNGFAVNRTDVLLLPASGEKVGMRERYHPAQTRRHAPSPGLRSLSSGRPLRAGPVGNPPSPRTRGEVKMTSRSAQKLALGGFDLIHALQAEDFVDGHNVLVDGVDAAVGDDPGENVLHR